MKRVLTIRLNRPFKVIRRKVYRSVRLTHPKARHLLSAERALGNGESVADFRRYQIALVAAVAEVPRSIIAEMPIMKLTLAWNFIRRFLDFPEEDGSPPGERAFSTPPPPKLRAVAGGRT